MKTTFHQKNLLKIKMQFSGELALLSNKTADILEHTLTLAFEKTSGKTPLKLIITFYNIFEQAITLHTYVLFRSWSFEETWIVIRCQQGNTSVLYEVSVFVMEQRNKSFLCRVCWRYLAVCLEVCIHGESIGRETLGVVWFQNLCIVVGTVMLLFSQ